MSVMENHNTVTCNYNFEKHAVQLYKLWHFGLKKQQREYKLVLFPLYACSINTDDFFTFIRNS